MNRDDSIRGRGRLYGIWLKYDARVAAGALWCSLLTIEEIATTGADSAMPTGILGSVVATNEELVDYLLHLDERFDADQVRAFREKFMSACDGHATDRIYQEVLA